MIARERVVGSKRMEVVVVVCWEEREDGVGRVNLED